MPIWSFTQERLDRLKEQIIRKKAEHDELQALSEKDLWCKDLEDFEETWDNQLKLDAEITTGLRRMSRYRNKKGAGRGRKAKDDADFMPVAARPKPSAKATAKSTTKTAKASEKVVEKKAKPAPKSSLFNKSRPRTDGTDDSDPFSDDDLAALKKKMPVKEEDEADEEESGAPAPARTKRAAATKAKSWIVDDDDDELESDDDDKMLVDVGDLVKGVGNNNGSASDTKTSRLGLFPMSRPESSHGDSTVLKTKSKPSKASEFKFDDFDSNDDTNYEMLAKPSPHKIVRNDDLDSFLSDDDLPAAPKFSAKSKAPPTSSEEPKAEPAAPAPAVKKARGKLASAKTKSKDAAPAKKAAASKAPELSPAAKTYAAKQSKPKPKKDDFDMDDDEDELESDDLESPPPRPAARGRPGRAAAARSRPVYVVDDDDDEDDSMKIDEPTDDFAMDDSE